MGALTLGRGTEDGVDVGPLVDESRATRSLSLVDDAVAKGARVVVGGSAPSGAGWFYEPTVLTDVPSSADLAREEIFGPVAPISTFSTDAEAIRMANDTVASSPTSPTTSRGPSRCPRRSRDSAWSGSAGIVSNPAAPFGGVKASVGREGGYEGIDEYLETKYVGIAL